MGRCAPVVLRTTVRGHQKSIASDARELTPKYPLWSDGATKRRWLVLPEGAEIDTSDMDHWQVPVGTKLFKEFQRDGRRMETRMIERVSASEYRFVPYVWLADESDAVATPQGTSEVDGIPYEVPPAEVCETCHGGEPGRLLGVSAIQLSDVLDELPLSNHPARTYPIAVPALGVLHANCGHCHNERGVAPMQTLRLSISDVDLPITRTAPYRTMVGVELTAWTEQGFDYRIAPGDPTRSAIYYRMAQRGGDDQMPPVGSIAVDEIGLATVKTWISGLAPRSVSCGRRPCTTEEGKMRPRDVPAPP